MDPYHELNSEEIIFLLKRLSNKWFIQAVNIWGRIQEAPKNICLGDMEFHSIDELDEYDSESSESIISISDFSYSKYKKAYRSKKSSDNRNNIVKISNHSFFTYEHINLIELFFKNHSEISHVHTSIYLSLVSLIKDANVILLECYSENFLKGFGVLSVFETRASFVCGFYGNSNSRASDAILSKAIEFCKENNLNKLHMGYSATSSLLSFKKKWGASEYGPQYREIFYTTNSEFQNIVNSSSFLWRDRIFVSKFK